MASYKKSVSDRLKAANNRHRAEIMLLKAEKPNTIPMLLMLKALKNLSAEDQDIINKDMLR